MAFPNSTTPLKTVAPTKVEPVSCPYCKESSPHLITTQDYNRRTSKESFDYFRCPQCGLVFLHPLPDDMGPFYAGGYSKIPESVAELRAIAGLERYRLEPVLRYKTCGKLLEIGPWMGAFCCNAKDSGFDVTAIEMDQRCVSFLNDILGIRALQSSDPASTLEQMNEQFDVIALWHCLEHLPTPWAVVELAAKRLAPGGILLIAIPNIASNEFSALKARWRHLDAPRHIYFYPPATLDRLAKMNCLETLELTTTDTLSLALGREAWHTWAVARFRIKYLRGAIGWIGFRRSTRRAFKENSGSGITAVFRKP